MRWYMKILNIQDSNVTLIFGDIALDPFVKEWCITWGWNLLPASDMAGCEDDTIVIFNMFPNIEAISRAKRDLIIIVDDK